MRNKKIVKKKTKDRGISSKYAQDIVETVRESVLILDHDLRVITANRSFYDTFKVDPKETEGVFLYDLGNRQWDIPELRKLLDNILPKKTSIESFQVEHVFPSIGRKTMLLNARRLRDKTQRHSLILLAIEDITEQEQARKKLYIVQKKLHNAEKFAELGKLAGMIGHDLRAILSVMKSSTYLMSKVKISDIQKKEYDKCIKILNKEIETADRMTANILTYSREKEPRLEQIAIRPLIKEILDRIDLPESIKVKIVMEEGIPLIPGDSVQLRQVFSNIIMNSAQAMSERGSIDINISRRNKYMEVSIADDGEGISREDLGSIFEPLFSTKKYGTGLGLSSCESIIKKHKGTIKVKSVPGEGTQVMIKLPIKT